MKFLRCKNEICFAGCGQDDLATRLRVLSYVFIDCCVYHFSEWAKLAVKVSEKTPYCVQRQVGYSSVTRLAVATHS